MDEYIKEAINKSIKKLDINELQQNKIDAKSSNFVKNLFKLVKNVLENNSVIITVVGGNAMEIKEFIGFLPSKYEEREIFTSIYEKDKENYSRSDEENEYNAIKLLIDYFICKWNKKVENLKFMYLVSNFLPYLVEKSYKIQMDELIPKLDYVEVPEVEFKSRKFSLANSTHKLSSTILTLNKFSSTRKNLWGYEFPTLNCKHSIFDRVYYKRFEKEPQHYAIMCYVPLIGLCTYPERLNSFSNILIAPDLSPFIRIALGIKRSEITNPSNAIIKSIFFRAIVKYKWHAFARCRLFGIFLLYLTNSCLFTVMVTINATTINTETISDVAISTIKANRKLTILSIILGIFQLLVTFRWTIILLVRRLRADIGVYLIILISVCSAFTEILEYKFLNLLLNFDVQEQFTNDHVSWYLNILSYFRSVSVFIIWIAINLDKLLQIVWLASLSSNYDYSEPWDKNNFVRLCIFIFSIFTTIIVVNLLIAFVNDIYTQTSENSDIVLNFVRARQIAFVELVFMLPSERNNEYVHLC
ncbi:hypothetical protein RhiirA5_416533 [Rhizophagus irregularis]|uniref:Uncharacterized protein n=1 Tax=Rhizophagus irregularis TaxID=588596 RepID=A0A2N0PPK0_9GLOM|nr:hypothetical protein RhiirA5_416533 [Rhizophagus irregularis]